MASDLTFEISINRTCPAEKLPQGDPRWYRFTRSFYQETHNLDSLTAEIQRGHSFAPVVKDGHRKQENFISAQHLGLDSDTGDWRSSLESLQADNFIARNAALLYETHSSTLEHPKARILFRLEEPCTDGLAYRTVQQGLAWKYGFTDQSVAEQSRFFYGARNCRVIKLNNVLREKVVEREVVGPYLEHLAEQSEHQKRMIPVLPWFRIKGATSRPGIPEGGRSARPDDRGAAGEPRSGTPDARAPRPRTWPPSPTADPRPGERAGIAATPGTARACRANSDDSGRARGPRTPDCAPDHG